MKTINIPNRYLKKLHRNKNSILHLSHQLGTVLHYFHFRSLLLSHSGSNMCIIVQLYGNYSEFDYIEFAMNMSKVQLVEDLQM